MTRNEAVFRYLRWSSGKENLTLWNIQYKEQNKYEPPRVISLYSCKMCDAWLQETYVTDFYLRDFPGAVLLTKPISFNQKFMQFIYLLLKHFKSNTRNVTMLFQLTLRRFKHVYFPIPYFHLIRSSISYRINE